MSTPIKDEHGAGVACKKCGKIVYLAIFDEYPLEDGYSTDGSNYEHIDCEDTLAIKGIFTMAGYLPVVIDAAIKRLKKNLEGVSVMEYTSEALKQIDIEMIQFALINLESIIPPNQDGKIAKSCRVDDA